MTEKVKKPAKKAAVAKRDQKPGLQLRGHFKKWTNEVVSIERRLAVNEAFAKHVAACEKNEILHLVTDYDVFVKELLDDPDFMKPPAENGAADDGPERNYKDTYSGDVEKLVWKG